MLLDKQHPTRRLNVKAKPVHFSVLGALGLAACGGGGGGTTPTDGGSSSGISLSGDVVKGPVSNALVFVDYNNDGLLSSGEPSQRTDANGNFEFTDLEAEGPIVAITDGASVDTSTGLVISGMLLTAPEGSTVISPLTTLMQQANLTSAEVASALNLASGIDLTSYNPFAAGVNADTALAVEIAAQQVSAIIRGISSAMTEAGVSSADAAELASNAVAEALADANSVDLTDSSFIASAITNATSGLSSSQASAVSQVASAVATATANLNEVVAQSTSISSSDQFALIDDLLDQITAALENDGDTSLIEFTDPQAVEDAVSGSGGSGGEEEQQNSAPTGGVSVSGTTTEGATLTAVTDALSDADGLGSFQYQWLRNGAEISGANSATYNLSEADIGTRISVQVAYTDGRGTEETVTSSVTSIITNTNDDPTGSVTISGSATQEQTLTAITDTLDDPDGLGTLSYQWKADGVAIAGATAQTLTLTQAQVGKNITVEVSYTDGGGTGEQVVSAATMDVVNVNDDPTGSIVINGTRTQGRTLTADVSLLDDADGLSAFAYQWLRDGVEISGADTSTYTLTEADVGSQINIEVSYTDEFGTKEVLIASPTDAITYTNGDPISLHQSFLIVENGRITQWDLSFETMKYSYRNTSFPTNPTDGFEYIVPEQYNEPGVIWFAYSERYNPDYYNEEHVEINHVLNEDGIYVATLMKVSDAEKNIYSFDSNFIMEGNGENLSYITINFSKPISSPTEFEVSFYDGKVTSSRSADPNNWISETTFLVQTESGMTSFDIPVFISGDLFYGGPSSYVDVVISTNSNDFISKNGISLRMPNFLIVEDDPKSQQIIRVVNGEIIEQGLNYYDVRSLHSNVSFPSTFANGITLSEIGPIEGYSYFNVANWLPDSTPIGYEWVKGEPVKISTDVYLTQTLIDRHIFTENQEFFYIEGWYLYGEGDLAGTYWTPDSVFTSMTAATNYETNDEMQSTQSSDRMTQLVAITDLLEDPDGLGDFDFQWLRDGSEIAGATAETYSVKQDDIGSEIAVEISYTDGYGTFEEVLSSGIEIV